MISLALQESGYPFAHTYHAYAGYALAPGSPHTFRHPRLERTALHLPVFQTAGLFIPGFTTPARFETNHYNFLNHIEMKRLLQKVDRIRASGTATLNLDLTSPYYHLSGKKYKVESMGTPDYKCRVTLLIDDKPADFTINDII